MTEGSFRNGREVVRFIDAHRDVLFLLSGGGSACVELPLEPWFTADEVARVNDQLIASGLPIAKINTVRRHLSAIKGGRLVRGRSVTLVYSDVATGALADVASGPTLSDPTTNEDAAEILALLGGFDAIVAKLRDAPETPKRVNSEAVLIADNRTLTAAAAAIVTEMGARPIVLETQIECDVEEAAAQLAGAAHQLRPGEVFVAGGEPTIRVRGDGRGGRCSELAVRFALRMTGVDALFGSSDGVDGNSGAAGIVVSKTGSDPILETSALDRSDSFAIATKIGSPIMMSPTGNNLRDLFLISRT